MCQHENQLEKYHEKQINFPRLQVNLSFSRVMEKSEGMSCLINKSKMVFLAYIKL